MTRYIFDSDKELDNHRINELKRRRKSKGNLHIKNAEFPEGYPKDGTKEEKIQFMIDFNSNNRPKWMK